MINMSSAMGSQFAELAAEINVEIKKLGPNPLGLNGDQNNSESENKR
jgi:coenzyme F420-reducing hydrogenase delta subunit